MRGTDRFFPEHANGRVAWNAGLHKSVPDRNEILPRDAGLLATNLCQTNLHKFVLSLVM